MIYKNAKRYDENDAKTPRACISLLAMFLSALITVVAAKIALNLCSKRSDFFAEESVAAETYNQYSMRLEAIKYEVLNELEAIANEE
jgi:hypothetical protein